MRLLKEAAKALLQMKKSGLRNQLIKSSKLQWLDIGSSSFQEGFVCLDRIKVVDVPVGRRFIVADLLQIDVASVSAMGTYDLIRMQHVFEHFSFCEGQKVLRICAQLLNPGGYLLITVPSLRKHIAAYVFGYRNINRSYVKWAEAEWKSRGALVPRLPDSYLFSTAARQFGEHKHFYDAQGLRLAIQMNGRFSDIRQLGLFNPLSSYPFTHNRPLEDLCVLARKV